MATDFRDLFRWVDYEIALNRTDTIHDFLSYLAEQMFMKVLQAELPDKLYE